MESVGPRVYLNLQGLLVRFSCHVPLYWREYSFPSTEMEKLPVSGLIVPKSCIDDPMNLLIS